MLKRIWESRKINVKTKINLYKSNVRSVLLYGCTTWCPSSADERKLEVFENKCMRNILRIFWPRRISNVELRERVRVEKLSVVVLRRRLEYYGHLIRSNNEIGKTAARWTPEGRRARERPGRTWRRSMEEELRDGGITWGEARRLAKDRNVWRTTTTALCAAKAREG